MSGEEDEWLGVPAAPDVPKRKFSRLRRADEAEAPKFRRVAPDADPQDPGPSQALGVPIEAASDGQASPSHSLKLAQTDGRSNIGQESPDRSDVEQSDEEAELERFLAQRLKRREGQGELQGKPATPQPHLFKASKLLLILSSPRLLDIARTTQAAMQGPMMCDQASHKTTRLRLKAQGRVKETQARRAQTRQMQRTALTLLAARTPWSLMLKPSACCGVRST